MNTSSLDDRPHLPYSIGTGIHKGGDAEIESYLESLRVQGFCVIERVIPVDQVARVRESVHRGRMLLQQDREAERNKRMELERDNNAGFQGGDDTVRPPMAPNAELCDIARNETFAEYLAEPRVLRVARAMLDTHVRILQTEVNKSSKPAGEALSEQRLRRRGWHSDWPHDLTAYGPSSERPWKHCGAVAQPFPDLGDQDVRSHVADQLRHRLHHLVGPDDRLVGIPEKADVGHAEIGTGTPGLFVLLIGVVLPLLLGHIGVAITLLLMQLLPKPLVVGGTPVGHDHHRGGVSLFHVIAHRPQGVRAIVGVGVDSQKANAFFRLQPGHVSLLE